MLLATGRADVRIGPNAQPWDLAALKIRWTPVGVFGSFKGSNTIYDGGAPPPPPPLRTM